MTKEELNKVTVECISTLDPNGAEKISAAMDEFKNTGFDVTDETHLAAMLAAKNAKKLLSRGTAPVKLTVNSVAGRDAAYMISVMDAFRAGQKIQYRLRPEDEWQDTPDGFEWLWGSIDYRVKPENTKEEPKYRPYANAKEFLDDQKKHGPYLNLGSMDSPILYLPVKICDTCIVTDEGPIKYTEMANKYSTLHFTWMDGAECGVLKGE